MENNNDGTMSGDMIVAKRLFYLDPQGDGWWHYCVMCDVSTYSAVLSSLIRFNQICLFIYVHVHQLNSDSSMV